MPIKIRQNIQARELLEQENIFVMTEHRAMTQDIRPLKIAVLNLMPTKVVTETQILRKLSNTPLQLEVEFLQTATYRRSMRIKVIWMNIIKLFMKLRNNIMMV